MTTQDAGIGRPGRSGRSVLQAPVTPQFAVGVFIMLIGVALLLERLGVAAAGFVFRLWPLGVIAFGVLHFTRGAQQHRFWGVFWIFTGSWLLLRSFGIIHLGFWELLIPVLLIAFGVSIVMRTLTDSGHVKPNTGTSPHLFAVMGESKQRLDGKPFEGAYLTAMMGSCDLDLRRATMQSGEERSIVVFGFMSGQVIRVPPEWQVVVKVAPVLGSVEDKRVPPVTPPPLDANPPRLIVQGTIIMSGVELKD